MNELNLKKQKAIVAMRDEKRMKFKEIAQLLGITRQRVHQIYLRGTGHRAIRDKSNEIRYLVK